MAQKQPGALYRKIPTFVAIVNPAGRALICDWFVNSPIIVVYEEKYFTRILDK